MPEMSETGIGGDPLAKLRKADRDHLRHGERHRGAEPRGGGTRAIGPGDGGLVVDVDRVRHGCVDRHLAEQALHALGRVKPVGERVGRVAQVAFELGQVGQPAEHGLDGCFPRGFVGEDALGVPREPLVRLSPSGQHPGHGP